MSGVMQAVLTNPYLKLDIEGLLREAFQSIDPAFERPTET
jgi:hypothetical protein